MIHLLRNGSGKRVQEASRRADEEVKKLKVTRRKRLSVVVKTVEEVVDQKRKEIEEEG